MSEPQHDWDDMMASRCTRCGEVIIGMYPSDINDQQSAGGCVTIHLPGKDADANQTLCGISYDDADEFPEDDADRLAEDEDDYYNCARCEAIEKQIGPLEDGDALDLIQRAITGNHFTEDSLSDIIKTLNRTGRTVQ